MRTAPRACTQVYHKPVACSKCGCSQDLPDDLQECRCQCHPANWPAGTSQQLLDALKRIRDIGYNSQSFRCTETVLACIRVAQEAILLVEAEREELGPGGG